MLGCNSKDRWSFINFLWVYTTGKQVELFSGQLIRERKRTLTAKKVNLNRDRSISSDDVCSLHLLHVQHRVLRQWEFLNREHSPLVEGVHCTKLLSSLTRLDLTEEENMFFVRSEPVESKLVRLDTRRLTYPKVESSLVWISRITSPR